MSFCRICGTQLPEDALFCPSCGTSVKGKTVTEHENAYYQSNSSQKAYSFFSFIKDTPDYTSSFHPQDIRKNKIMAIFAYLGLLWFIPFFAARNSPYTKFHLNQGLIVSGSMVIYGIISLILSEIIKIPVFTPFGSILITPIWLSSIFFIISLPLLAYMILGIVYAATDKAKELPFIGKIKLI